MVQGLRIKKKKYTYYLFISSKKMGSKGFYVGN